MSAARSVDPESVRDALDHILTSRSFRRSVQLSNFLRFTVERTLEGRLDDIKEPKFRKFADASAFQALARTLHARWQSHLETFGPTVSVLPPPLPTPDEYFAQSVPFATVTDDDSQ